MRKYEGMFIFVPNLEEEKRNATLDRIKGIIETDGEIDTVDEWGLRKLAYEINDLGEGYYVLINFTTTPEVKDELDRVVKISDSVMRHMIVRDEK